MTEHGPMEEQRVSRRSWLGRATLAGTAVGAGAIAGGGTAAALNGWSPRRSEMVVEVACLGTTFREQRFPDPPEANDLRGTPFSVEGWIYPEGTVPSEGFVATDTEAIGHWFCAGFNIQHGERPEPHLNAMATFVFGRISESELFPPDSLVSSGLGGTLHDGVDSLRPIIGGSGAYLGVIGQVGRTNLGTNNTVLFGPGVPAPNFRYVFELLHLV